MLLHAEWFVSMARATELAITGTCLLRGHYRKNGGELRRSVLWLPRETVLDSCFAVVLAFFDLFALKNR